MPKSNPSSPSAVGSRTVHKQLAMFEALRRLGFQSDDIYVSWDEVKKAPLTILRRDEKNFVIDYPESFEHPESKELYRQEWMSESERWNTVMSMVERDSIYRSYVNEALYFDLVMSLRLSGIFPPRLNH